MASAFSDSLMACGGWNLSGTTKGMTIKFLPNVDIHNETQDQNKILT